MRQNKCPNSPPIGLVCFFPAAVASASSCVALEFLEHLWLGADKQHNKRRRVAMPPSAWTSPTTCAQQFVFAFSLKEKEHTNGEGSREKRAAPARSKRIGATNTRDRREGRHFTDDKDERRRNPAGPCVANTSTQDSRSPATRNGQAKNDIPPPRRARRDRPNDRQHRSQEDDPGHWRAGMR